MAAIATATPTEEQVPKVALRLLVDKEKNRVLFAEAGKDFVDVLLSFLTLPLGTIARLISKESNMEAVRVGSLSSLYESAANLEEEHLCTPTCKEMLLKPRNSMESYCKRLKLNIDDTDPTKYFICSKWDCSIKESGARLSIFSNLRCDCGKLMNREITKGFSDLKNGFVQETATFIMGDDLNIMPNFLGTGVDLLQNLGIEDMDATEEETVNVSSKEVVDLLKCSLLSNTPLTDMFLKKKPFLDNFVPSNQPQFEIGEVPADDGRKMVVKVLVRKSNGKILFAQAEEDFVDFLFSFLTFPLGGVLHMFEGRSSLSCIDKLYNSVAELSSERQLISQGIKDNLANPKCAPQFNIKNQILPVEAACFPMYYCSIDYRYTAQGARERFGYLETSPQSWVFDAPLTLIDPKSAGGEISSPGGFVKGPSMYMVTDDLVVTPISCISGVSYLNRFKVPLRDLEKRVISIGLKEGLSILKASLISTSALTNGLNQILKTIKEED